MKEAGLKNCRCGAEAKIYRHCFDTFEVFRITCEKCKKITVYDAEKEMAIAHWNQIMGTENRVLALEELREYCKQDLPAPLWIERNGDPKGMGYYLDVREMRDTGEMEEVLTAGEKYNREYNRKWRLWMSKPTAEETAATTWAGEENEQRDV